MSSALDPRLIEREIARIREKESTPYSLGTKTNLFTLVILRGTGAVPTDNGTRTGTPSGVADLVEQAMGHLLGRRPARVITLSRGGPGAAEAWVSGRCFPDRQKRGVCFEEVRIDSNSDDPGYWAPLLIRDLPVFAWLPDGLPAEGADPWAAMLRAASGLIDKLLVDSSQPAGQTADGAVRGLRCLRESAGGACILSDFAWRRSRVLREQSARAFDPPEMRPLLARVREARLFGGSRAEAALFFGWLRSRLARSPSTAHEAPGPLSEGFSMRFLVDGAAAVQIGCTRGGCLFHGDEKAGYRFPADGEILLAEVDSLTRDTLFEESLAHAEPVT